MCCVETGDGDVAGVEVGRGVGWDRGMGGLKDVGDEIVGGDDSSGFVTAKCQESAFIAGDQEIGIAGFGHGEEEIVEWVGGSFHGW